MALQFHVSPFICSTTPFSSMFPLQGKSAKVVCMRKSVVYASASQSTDSAVKPDVVRRSANYAPNVWNYDDILSLKSVYSEDIYKEKASQLKDEVRQLLVNDSAGTDCLDELVDAIQRLGVAYHFKLEIKSALNSVYINKDQWLDDDLYTASLRFRLLRNSGFDVQPADVFDKFKDENGSLKTCLTDDVKGILSLYEASYLGLEDEDFMDEAKTFTTKHLKDYLKGHTSPLLAEKVEHALELPLHWRTTRLEARWYIDIYEKSEDNMIPAVLDLAKLDFNIVQAIYQAEVVKMTRWWVDLGLNNMKGLNKMDFFRDRLLEHYFWSLGLISEPKFGRFRIDLAKITQTITLLDDIYDVYGSLEELELFTKAVERWNVSAVETLPPYMQVCYLGLLNTNNAIAYETLKEQGVDITPNQKKVWLEQCKLYLVESKWFYEKHTPTLEEYMKVALVTVGAPNMLIHSYILTTEKITKECLDYVESLPSLLYDSSYLARLADDLGTASDEIARGDNPKAIQCYMHEAGVSEEVARQHINYLMHEYWKKVNKAMVAPHPISEPATTAPPNIVRQSHCMYQFGDGHEDDFVHVVVDGENADHRHITPPESGKPMPWELSLVGFVSPMDNTSRCPTLWDMVIASSACYNFVSYHMSNCSTTYVGEENDFSDFAASLEDDFVHVVVDENADNIPHHHRHITPPESGKPMPWELSLVGFVSPMDNTSRCPTLWDIYGYCL
ncbi:Alpha-terpineol synthase protein [Thalictrum thalictroides]|uniref:Alpha-terpineol synthase protein n=1 Tax=Thalictrum thalictroides TaxID=46969 RepID=A0A7J6VP83_THATH|nr:Alpha-terpineol synthase protein [Thalictrum thalictroides]